MNKTILFLLCFIFAFTSLQSKELIVNGGFETWQNGNLSNWTNLSGITLTEEIDSIHGGFRSAKVALTTTDQAITDFRQTVNLIAGIPYSISFWVYHLDTTSRITIYVAGKWTNKYSKPELVNQWQQVTYEYTALVSGAAEVGLRFYDLTGFTNPSLMYIDDFSVFPLVSTAPEITNIVTNPEIPNQNSQVSISATISDNGTINSAYLYYGYDGINFNDSIQMSGIVNGTFTTISAIPAKNLGTIVYYKIKATDNDFEQDSSIVKNYNLSILEPGDIVFLQYKYDKPDGFSFLVLKDIPGNSIITFTDNAWNGTELFANEGSVIWTTPTEGISARTVVNYDSINSGSMTVGSVEKIGIMAFSDFGDVIFAYTGDASNPTFISAISTLPWITTEPITNNNSYLPSSLADGITAIAFSQEFDEGYFSIQNIPENNVDILLSVYNEANWIFENDPTLIPFQDVNFWNVTLGNEMIENTKISIYPNPVTDFLNIDSDIKISNIVISNVLGQEIHNIDTQTNISKINFELLNSGLYFITLMDKNQIIESYRIIKK